MGASGTHCDMKGQDKAMKRLRPWLLVSVGASLMLGGLWAQTPSPEVRPGGGSAYFQALVREAKTRIREVHVDQLATLRAASPAPILVDVREDNEWNRSRIPGAIHVGRGVLETRIESRVPEKGTPLILYCHSGGRSAVAADVLARMGYTHVVSLDGGVLAYQAAGLPLDRATPAE